MKKTKLLFPILGVPALMATLIPAVVSCNPTPVDPTDDEKVIMPDVGTQEAQYVYDEEVGSPYSYITITGFKWINPKHTFDDLYAEAEAWGSTLPTEIVQNEDLSTFDVKIYLYGDNNQFRSGTKLDIDLSIWVYNEESEDIQISENKTYSMMLNEKIMLLDTNYVPNAMVESTGRVEAHLLILNGQYELTEVTNTKVDALPSKYGDITVEAGYIDESEGFYYDIVVPFNFSTYVTDYDEGFTTSVHVECSKEDNGTCTINASAKSLTTPVLDFNAPENIILSTNDGVVYEGELEAGTYEWVNPETEGQTAGDLTWTPNLSEHSECIQSIEVSPSSTTTGAIHFKFTFIEEPAPGAEYDIVFYISYKNIKANLIYIPLTFIINNQKR